MSRNRMFRTMWAGLVLFSLVAFLGACGGGGDGGGGAKVTGTITLVADVTSIPADGSSSANITATLKDSAGKPVANGTSVTFTTTLGRFRNGSTSYTVQTLPSDPTNIKSDPTGQVTVALIAGTTAGSAKVTASGNGVSQSIYIALSGSSAGITLTASPASIPADGQSSTTITATLTDSSGGPVTPGTPVTFTTGLGSFVSADLSPEQQSAANTGSKTYTVATPDSTGIVNVSLIADLVPGTTYVVATSNDISQAVSVVLTNLYVSKISIKADPVYIQANGSSQSVVTATVTDVGGTPIEQAPVTFYDASVSTEPTPLPDYNTWKGVNANLHVTPEFYCYSGTVSFTLTYSGSSTSNFAVRLWNRDTGNINSVLINTTGPVTGQLVTQTLGAGNYYFQVTAEGEWTIKVEGSIGPAQAGKPKVLAVTRTDQNGKAVYTYTSTKTVGVVKIKAETGEPNVTGSTEALSATAEIIQTAGPPPIVTVTAGDDALYANGASQTNIDVLVLTKEGKLAPDGTVVTLSTTAGTLGSTSLTTIDGKASTTLTATASSTSTTATVTATVGSDSASTTVSFVGVSLSDMQANPTTIFANGTDTSEISVRIRDANGLAVVGESVTFTTTLGSIQTATATTGSDGVAKTNLIASTTTGSATVTAAYGSITATTTVTFTSSVPVGTITLTANPTSIPADGTSSSTITATLKDTSGKAVPKGTSVTFTTNLGKLGSGNQTQTVITPDTSGVVSVSLISGTTAGSATVTATSNSVTQSVTVTFTGTVVGSITVTATPSTLTADGKSTSEIRAAVKDAQGNPIDGEAITFTITSGTGSLSASSASTIGGYATVTYTAGTTSGSVIIQARAQNNVSGTVTITLTSTTVGTISLTASPASIPADGSSSSVVTAIIKDQSGNAVAKGTSLTFTTTLGKFSNGGASYSLTTPDNTGMVTVSLIAATTAGTATVVCSSSGASQTTTVAFIGSGEPASLTLATSKASVKSDNSDSATITATLLDGNNAPISGFVVAFSADTGQISASSATTDATGKAKITFSAGSDSTNRTATITATVAGPAGPITASIPIKILGSTLTLTTDKTTLPADGSVVATLTATAKDGNGSPLAGASIAFTVSGTGGATVSPTSGTTNASGILQVTVTGTAQGAVTVTADWESTTAAQQYNVTAAADTFAIVLPADSPFATKTRTTASLVTTADNVTIAFTDSNPDTITRSDGGSFIVDGYVVGDTIMVGGSTNNDGAYTLAGVAAGALTLVSTDSLTAEPAGSSVTITNGVLVRVRAPDPIANVAFATTIGVWDGGTSPIKTKSVPASNYVWAVLTSNLAGTATVQVYDAADPSTSDKTTVAFSVPSGDAAQLALQSNVYMVAPSIGGTKNTATLTATVRTSLANGNQVVSGVAVAFSIVNPTGGGEYVEPVVAITDSAGQAKATFTSGSLSSGAQGVTISAYVVDDPTVTDSIAVVIGGTAGSVVIGRGTVIYDVDDATYRLPMSALVTDSNGNAVSGAVVTLSAWPLQYAPGVWYDTDPDPKAEKYAVYYTGAFIDNEDANENLILDPGEDKDGDGKLTPASSSAGGVPVPSEVTTGSNGVASFNLIYLKANAKWIKTRVRASTFVVGTETTSSVEMVLPAEKTQAESGLLPDSPFPIGLVTGTAVDVTYTFPTFYGTGDTFTTSGNLSKGTSKAELRAGTVLWDYTYTPPTAAPFAVPGDIIWDYISVINTSVGLGAYFPVRIIIQ